MIKNVNMQNVPVGQTQYQKVDAVGKQEKIPAPRPVESSVGEIKDQVTLSQEGLMAQEVAKYNKILKDIPDVDEARVQSIKEQVRSGTYLTAEKAYKTVEKMLDALRNL
ncbi:MAG: flagellar biosynthesis anti-sigma factor FlgM [Candidatus Omnitrophica bacterium]|nr:flagellar biosynthesis anti-sigma factor FlgM [Candidatus Omnitrophota bacterium]